VSVLFLHFLISHIIAILICYMSEDHECWGFWDLLNSLVDSIKFLFSVYTENMIEVFKVAYKFNQLLSHEQISDAKLTILDIASYNLIFIMKNLAHGLFVDPCLLELFLLTPYTFNLYTFIHATYENINLNVCALMDKGNLVNPFTRRLNLGKYKHKMSPTFLVLHNVFSSVSQHSVIFLMSQKWNVWNPCLYFLTVVHLGQKMSLIRPRIILAFLVKIPIFSVHLWLPKAHVEAPVRGSIILAGILLKLGGYGLLRVYNLLIRIGCKINLNSSFNFIHKLVTFKNCMSDMELQTLETYKDIIENCLVLPTIFILRSWCTLANWTLKIISGFCISKVSCFVKYNRIILSIFLFNEVLYLPFHHSMLFIGFVLYCSLSIYLIFKTFRELCLANDVNGWIVFNFLCMIQFFTCAHTISIGISSQWYGSYPLGTLGNNCSANHFSYTSPVISSWT
ncbi:hypothetical protein L9F63_001731, partial [Diploptera punctata]